MKVLVALVTLGLIAGCTANFMATFDDCCTKSNVDADQKKEIVDAVKTSKDPATLSPPQMEAVVCTGKAMKVVNSGKLNTMMISMAASAVMNSAEKSALKKCLGNIKGVTDEVACYKGLECSHNAKQG